MAARPLIKRFSQLRNWPKAGACLVGLRAHQDVVCDVPRLMGNPKAALMGFGRHVILDPNVHKVGFAAYAAIPGRPAQ